MKTPELINSSAPHRIAVDEGSRDAKGRKSYVVEEDRQPAVNSDDMADAMDAANRKKVSFSAETTTNAEKKESIYPEVEVTKASVLESADQDRPASPATLLSLEVAQPLPMQRPAEEISTEAALSTVAKTTVLKHPEPDPHIAARLETLKAQNNAVRTSLDAFDSQSLAKA